MNQVLANTGKWNSYFVSGHNGIKIETHGRETVVHIQTQEDWTQTVEWLMDHWRTQEGNFKNPITKRIWKHYIPVHISCKESYKRVVYSYKCLH